MSNINSAIESRIRAFVAELNTLVRQAAVDAVGNALGGGAAPAKRGPGRPRKTSASRTSVPPTTHGRRAVGGIREPAALAKIVERVRDYIVANPVCGVEKIGPALGLTTAQIALPIKKLLRTRHIVRRGAKRGTRYLPGPNASGALPTTTTGRPPKG